MDTLAFKLYGLNWRLVLALTSMAAFALAGAAGDPTGY